MHAHLLILKPVPAKGAFCEVLTGKYSYTLLQVPLGILLKSETNYEDMVGIMDHLHRYVPTVTTEYYYEDQESGTHNKVSGDHFHHLLMGKCVMEACALLESQCIMEVFIPIHFSNLD